MKHAVYKYPFRSNVQGDAVEIEMPRGARVLDIKEQYGILVLWALVEPHIEKEVRRFIVLPTGLLHDDSGPRRRLGDHISTVLLEDGRFVLHIFESML